MTKKDSAGLASGDDATGKTLKFLSAVQEQLTAIDKPGVMNRWLHYQPDGLMKTTENWLLGK